MNLNEIGVEMVTIDLPFKLNHVNCFIAEGDNGLTIIDTGLNNDTSKLAWEKSIAGRKVSNIFLTHYHPDHYGFAGEFQQQTGAKVWITKEDADNAKIAWDPKTSLTYEGFYEKCGVSNELLTELIENSRGFQKRVTPHPTIDHFFDEHMKVIIGNYEYEVIFTPGHSGGLVCFYNKDKSILFSTDHVLPKITPNISYHIYGLQNPLEAYLQSLEKIKPLEAEFVIPSHGKPFYNANQRIEEIIEHHKERLAVTYDIIKEGSTIVEACEKLFQKELTVHDIRFAIGETVAHLDYLHQKNECTKEVIDGKWYYKIKG